MCSASHCEKKKNGSQCLEISNKREPYLVQISVSGFQLCLFGQLCSPVKPYLLERCNLTKGKENNTYIYVSRKVYFRGTYFLDSKLVA